MRYLIGLCSTALLHRVSLAPTASATAEADSRPALPPRCGGAPPAGAVRVWAAVAALADRWFRRRVESRLAGRVTGTLPTAAMPGERPTPSRYY
jgi:hypothetical protein